MARKGCLGEGLGRSQFKGPEAGVDWTCSGHIPEASAAQGGGVGALGMRTLCLELVLDGFPVCLWSQPLLNRHHPVSLRCLRLTVRVFGQPIQGGRKEWGRQVGAMGGVEQRPIVTCLGCCQILS